MANRTDIERPAASRAKIREAPRGGLWEGPAARARNNRSHRIAWRMRSRTDREVCRTNSGHGTCRWRAAPALREDEDDITMRCGLRTDDRHAAHRGYRRIGALTGWEVIASARGRAEAICQVCIAGGRLFAGGLFLGSGERGLCRGMHAISRRRGRDQYRALRRVMEGVACCGSKVDAIARVGVASVGSLRMWSIAGCGAPSGLFADNGHGCAIEVLVG